MDDKKFDWQKSHLEKIRRLCRIRLVISALIFTIVTGFAIKGKSIDQIVNYLKPFTEVFSVEHLFMSLVGIVIVQAILEKIVKKNSQLDHESKTSTQWIKELGEEIPRTLITFGGVVVGVCLVAFFLAATRHALKEAAVFLGCAFIAGFGFHTISVWATYYFSDGES